jgi:hypothetical protein
MLSLKQQRRNLLSSSLMNSTVWGLAGKFSPALEIRAGVDVHITASQSS